MLAAGQVSIRKSLSWIVPLVASVLVVSSVAAQQLFNYTLTNSGDIKVNVSSLFGGSGSNTITATLTAGSTQSVSFLVSGLPSGATAGFRPGGGPPPCSSQLTISTPGATPTGTFPITVTGSPLSKTTTFNLVVNPPFNYTLGKSGTITVAQGGAGYKKITATR